VDTRSAGNGCPRWSGSAAFLIRHVEGIAAYCDHAVRVAVVASVDTTIKASMVTVVFMTVAPYPKRDGRQRHGGSTAD
jgi:hypothetical protein